MAERWHKMAVDGSIMPSMRVRLVAGELVADAWVMRHSDTLMDTPQEALTEVLKSGVAYMRTTGAQWMELQRLFVERKTEQ